MHHYIIKRLGTFKYTLQVQAIEMEYVSIYEVIGDYPFLWMCKLRLALYKCYKPYNSYIVWKGH